MSIIIIFHIVTPYVSDNVEDVNVKSNDQSIMEIGEIVNITWSPKDLTEGLLLDEDTAVDIAMVRYV